MGVDGEGTGRDRLAGGDEPELVRLLIRQGRQVEGIEESAAGARIHVGAPLGARRRPQAGQGNRLDARRGEDLEILLRLHHLSLRAAYLAIQHLDLLPETVALGRQALRLPHLGSQAAHFAIQRLDLSAEAVALGRQALRLAPQLFPQMRLADEPQTVKASRTSERPPATRGPGATAATATTGATARRPAHRPPAAAPAPGWSRTARPAAPSRQLFEVPPPEVELAAALVATAGQVLFELAQLLALQRAQRVGREELFDAGVWGVLMLARSMPAEACSPNRMRDLTVPSGASSRVAIWVCVSPSKKASSMQRRWSGDSCPRAELTWCRRSRLSSRSVPTGRIASCVSSPAASSRRRDESRRRSRSRAGAGLHQDPAARSGARFVVAVGLHPDLEENLLQHLLGLATPAKDAIEQAQRHRRMGLEQERKRSAVPGGHPSHDRDPRFLSRPSPLGERYLAGRVNVKEAQKLSQSAPASGGAGIMLPA